MCRWPARFALPAASHPLDKRALTLHGLLLLALETFTDFDGKFMRTFRKLVNQPGILTQAYVRGERRRHVGPSALFFSINALFFIIQSLANVNIFSSPLESHMDQQDWSTLAQTMVTQRLHETHSTLDRYALLFNKAVPINAKALIVLMSVPFTLILPVVFVRSARPFMTHVVFSMHLYAFLLVLFCVAMAVPTADMLFGGAGLQSARMDNLLSVFNLLACAVYLYIAVGRVCDATGIWRWA